ncbi:MAG: hypothetical protein ACKOB2_00415 [Solirubrobacterales bacterium]
MGGRSNMGGEEGSTTVEQTGLLALLGLAFAAALLFIAGGLGPETGRGLATRIANRIACGPLEPGPCPRHPAVDAYGPTVAAALRAVAPSDLVRQDGAGRNLLPVDYRRCRIPSCAEVDPARPELDLTLSNRRTTLFTEASRSGGRLDLTWWAWRPGIGWDATHRSVGTIEADAVRGTPVRLSDSPMLVPLEALDGRNHTRFGPDERPPWQWAVPSNHDSRTE